MARPPCDPPLVLRGDILQMKILPRLDPSLGQVSFATTSVLDIIKTNKVIHMKTCIQIKNIHLQITRIEAQSLTKIQNNNLVSPTCFEISK